MQSKSHWRISRLVSWLAVVTILLIAAFVMTNRQPIADYVRAWQYEPSQEMVKIRDSLGLTAEGQVLFNASHSVLQSAEAFNTSCGQKRETNNPIIGCYSQQQIYVFDVTNNDLAGIEETTAAHELLHAAYERLGTDERERLDSLLKAAYQRVATPELRERMEYYEKSEPGQEYNELHSILGSEQPNLGNELETHYARYFTSRAKVIAYHDAYHSVFVKTAKQIESLATAINARTKQVNQAITNYNAKQKALTRDVDTFNRQAKDGTFTTRQAFENERTALISRQETLRSEANALQGEVASIDILRKKYETLQAQHEGLARSINSSLPRVKQLTK